MKYQNLLSGKNKKNIFSISSAELAQRVVIKIHGLILRRIDANGRFSPFFTRATTFMTYCLRFFAPVPFWVLL